jgi:ATP-dependent DNA helicase RecQ
MNHLQIPAGSGETISYDFDIALFARSFKVDILTATYAIKALEQEGVFVFNSSFFKPSTVVFTCSKEVLNDLEKQQPLLDDMAKALLRSYEGIFDFPAAINENSLVSFTKQSKEAVIKQLQQLNSFGIIAYQPQKEKPQLTLLQNRMYADSFVINLDDYLKRKALFDERVHAVCAFAGNSLECRSKQIASYFNAAFTKNCGICDNCINQQEIKISTEEFEVITGQIYSRIDTGLNTIHDLLGHLSKIKKEKYWKVLDYLQAEQKIILNKEGKLIKKI